jgi:integrase
MIYCCGLRNSEACNLLRSDVDLARGTANIIRSKGLKDRIVYLATDMMYLCERYDHEANLLLPDREYFFISHYDKHLRNTTVCKIFDNIVAKTSFRGKTSKKPTCQGLRHLFAVNSMRKCLADGGDFGTSIFYLSRYLGHSSPEETLYYLHLTMDLAGGIREMASGFEDVIGGVWHVEA